MPIVLMFKNIQSINVLFSWILRTKKAHDRDGQEGLERDS
jgi:hypothetical protein